MLPVSASAYSAEMFASDRVPIANLRDFHLHVRNAYSVEDATVCLGNISVAIFGRRQSRIECVEVFHKEFPGAKKATPRSRFITVLSA